MICFLPTLLHEVSSIFLFFKKFSSVSQNIIFFSFHTFNLGLTCFAWNSSNSGNMNNLNVGRRDLEAAGALGVMTVFTGVLYLIDFFYVIYQNALNIRNERY